MHSRHLSISGSSYHCQSVQDGSCQSKQFRAAAVSPRHFVVQSQAAPFSPGQILSAPTSPGQILSAPTSPGQILSGPTGPGQILSAPGGSCQPQAAPVCPTNFLSVPGSPGHLLLVPGSSVSPVYCCQCLAVPYISCQSQAVFVSPG
jgi:hypothetical protein